MRLNFSYRGTTFLLLFLFLITSFRLSAYNNVGTWNSSVEQPINANDLGYYYIVASGGNAAAHLNDHSGLDNGFITGDVTLTTGYGSMNGNFTYNDSDCTNLKYVAMRMKLSAASASADNVKFSLSHATAYITYSDWVKSAPELTTDYQWVVFDLSTPGSNTCDNTTPWFRVRIQDGFEKVDISDIYISSKKPQYLYTPIVTATAAGTNRINLSWGAVDAATSYEVYRSTSSDGTYTKVGTPTANSYTDNAVNPNTTYFYKVVSVNGANHSAYSKVASAKTDALPTPISGLKTDEVQSQQISLSWNDSSNANSYNIYRSADGEHFSLVASNVSTKNYTDTQLHPETTYYYKVQVSNGFSEPSSVLSATTTELITQVTITVNPKPVCNITGEATICPKGETTYSVASGTGYSYAWEITGDASILSGASTNEVTVKAGNSCGSFKLSVTVTTDKHCENSCEKTVSVADTENPVITGTIAKTNINACSVTAKPAAVNTVAALEALGVSISDNCTLDEDLVVTSEDVTTGTCPITVTRTYTVKDLCNHTATVTHVIEIKDSEKPEVSPLASSGDLGCNPTVTAPAFTVTDNCDANLTADVVTDGPTHTGCDYTQTWTATATDACGNVSETKTITYTWKQTAAPSISPNVTGSDLGCNPASIPTLTASDFTVTDACAANPLATVTSDAVQTNGCQKSQTWRANYTNACDQSAPEVTVTYTWTETTAPGIAPNVTGSDLGCNPASIPTLTASDFTVTDACAANPSATVTTDGIQTNGCQKSQTWRANYTNACD
ncbi:MAG: hypothetical protein ILP24_05320, partial [Paludibacteraceae bacterium]|nr:hypothetical protein [Paludibacteraceae bacterium]